MPPLLSPFPPASKEPPDRASRIQPSSAPRPTMDTSIGMNQEQPQPPASSSVRPPFAPFFTLIHDTTTSATYHPRKVHYIFFDDDPSALTSACLEALNPPSSTSSFSRPLQAPNPSTSSSSTTSKSPSSSTAAPHNNNKPNTKRENRILLLDLDTSGTSVTKAHSLSSSWQILSTSLTPAPTWAESPSEPSVNGAGFMLKISGTDGSQTSSGTGTANVGLGLGKEGRGTGKCVGKDAAGPGGLTEPEFQALLLEFEQRMKVLRTVVDAGVEVGRQGAGEEEVTVERGEDTCTATEGEM